MTKTEFETLRAKIEERYRQDLAALDRLWWMFRGDEPAPVSPAEPPKAGQNLSRQNKAWRARKKLARSGRDAAIPKSEFRKFLVAGPVAAGGNGDE